MKDTIDVAVRRSPKYSAFILVGVFLGMVAGGVLGLMPVDTSEMPQQFSRASAVWLLMVVLGIVGGFAGAIVALILDRRSLKRARTYTVGAEFEEVRASGAPADGAPSDAIPADDPTTASAEPEPGRTEAAESDAEEGPGTEPGASRSMGE